MNSTFLRLHRIKRTKQYRNTNTGACEGQKELAAAETEKTEERAVIDTEKFGLKLLIDNESSRVLYAEANKEVVDFLFSLLALPLGTVSSLISNKDVIAAIGSVSSLRNSLEQLDLSYIASDGMKNALLNPSCGISSSQIPNYNAGLLLMPNIPTAMNIKFYMCSYQCNAISENYGTKCTAGCRYGIMNVEMQMNDCKSSVAINGEETGCVKGVVTYSVMDDLTVVPMSTISSIILLNKFHIKDFTALEERNVFLGLQEALGLLKASLRSKTVLTDVFLAK